MTSFGLVNIWCEILVEGEGKWLESLMYRATIYSGISLEDNKKDLFVILLLIYADKPSQIIIIFSLRTFRFILKKRLGGPSLHNRSRVNDISTHD